MGPWVRLLVLFAAVAVAALFLKVLHPLIVLAILVGGVGYANHVLTVKPRRERSSVPAEMLGMRPAPAEQATIAGMPFALLGRPQARVRDVIAGPWRGVQVQLFDLETASSIALSDSAGLRRWSCVLAPLALEAPHLVAEPRAFLTAETDRPAYLACVVDAEEIAAAFEVRCEDPAFASSFLSGAVAEWLSRQQERVAIETRASTVLLYASAVPLKDRGTLLEALGGLLDAVEGAGG